MCDTCKRLFSKLSMFSLRWLGRFIHCTFPLQPLPLHASVTGKGHPLYISITISSIACFHSVYFHCTLPFCNTTTIAYFHSVQRCDVKAQAYYAHAQNRACVVHTCYFEASCITGLRRPAWTGSV